MCKEHVVFVLCVFLTLESKKEHWSLSVGLMKYFVFKYKQKLPVTVCNTSFQSAPSGVWCEIFVPAPQGMRCPLSAQSNGNLNIHNPTGHTIISSHHYSNPKL